jgi:hypothetical protein
MYVTIELPDEFAQPRQTMWQDTLAHYVRERPALPGAGCRRLLGAGCSSGFAL